MNKRFFTLMAAVMLAGAPLCNEAFAEIKIEAQDNVTDNVVLADGVKFIVKVNNTTNNYVKVNAPVKVDATGITYVTGINYTTNAADAAVFEVTNFQTSPLGATFELKVNGKPYALSLNGSDFAVVAAGTAKEKVFTSFTATSTNGKYTVKDAKVSLIAGTSPIQFATANS